MVITQTRLLTQPDNTFLILWLGTGLELTHSGFVLANKFRVSAGNPGSKMIEIFMEATDFSNVFEKNIVEPKEKNVKYWEMVLQFQF